MRSGYTVHEPAEKLISMQVFACAAIKLQ